jgi:hypothetical protein
MNTMQEIEIKSAIAKLVAERDAAMPGSWTDDYHYDIYPKEDEPLDLDNELHPANARLITTLHRTIDAQLKILTEGLLCLQSGLRYGYAESHALAIARAINGDE